MEEVEDIIPENAPEEEFPEEVVECAAPKRCSKLKEKVCIN